MSEQEKGFFWVGLFVGVVMGFILGAVVFAFDMRATYREWLVKEGVATYKTDTKTGQPVFELIKLKDPKDKPEVKP